MTASHGHRSVSVAIVGGGAAGLIAAMEMLQAGHRVTVYERGSTVGGVWHYTDDVDDHPLSLGNSSVHSSMYSGLRTNLPREVMGLQHFPFDAKFEGSRDARQFPGHDEVQRYLEALANKFGLLQHVRFNTEVQRLKPLRQAGSTPSDVPSTWLRWEVKTCTVGQEGSLNSSSSSSSSSSIEQFDAVVVANGHYSRPRLPQIAGQDVFPGLQMHSHNYRRPETFNGKTVVLLGASSSGVDIAEELSSAGAKRVYLCAKTWQNPLTGASVSIDDTSITSTGSSTSSVGGPCGVVKAPNIQQLHADGSVTLADGSRIKDVDAVMYCTGYMYSFPFLDGTDLISVTDNRVGPLYQHVFPPAAAPTLSFVGLCFKVVPFPQFSWQSRWIARVLAGVLALPSQTDMERHIADFYKALEADGTPVRYTHQQSGGLQWSYNAWLAQQCGEQPEASWRREMYDACGQSRKLNGAHYRDVPLPNAEAAEQAARQDAARARSLCTQPAHVASSA